MPSTKNLYTAFLAAQKAMGPVLKDKTNPAFRAKYADLEAVLDTVREPLNDHGLILAQPLEDRDGRLTLRTVIIHGDTGEMFESSAEVRCADPDNPQKMGGAITYYRRYSLLAMLGLAPEDDDGNLAAQPRPVPQARNTPTRPSAPPGGADAPQPRQSPQRTVDTSTGEILDDETPQDWTEFWKWARENGYKTKDDVEAAIGQPMSTTSPQAIHEVLSRSKRKQQPNNPGPVPSDNPDDQSRAMKRLHVVGAKRNLSHDDLHLLGLAAGFSSLTEMSAQELRNLGDWIEDKDTDDGDIAGELNAGQARMDEAELAKPIDSQTADWIAAIEEKTSLPQLERLGKDMKDKGVDGVAVWASFAARRQAMLKSAG